MVGVSCRGWWSDGIVDVSGDSVRPQHEADAGLPFDAVASGTQPVDVAIDGADGHAERGGNVAGLDRAGGQARHDGVGDAGMTRAHADTILSSRLPPAAR